MRAVRYYLQTRLRASVLKLVSISLACSIKCGLKQLCTLLKCVIANVRTAHLETILIFYALLCIPL